MQRTAVGWLAWELTRSPAWVGFVAFADLAATIVVGPFGGLIADRRSRRRIMLVTQSVLAVAALLLAVLVAQDALDPLGLAGLVAVHGAIVGINQPARLAFVPSLVPRDALPAAVALKSVIFNGARLVGPALAGATIAGFGLASAFLVNAVSYSAFILALLTIEVEEVPPRGASKGWRGEFAEGVLHLARHPALGPLFLAFVIASLLVRPLPELLPALAAQAFAGDIHTLALMSSTLGLGAVLGGLWVAGAPGHGLVRLCLLAMGVAAAAAMAVALSPTLPIVLPAIALGGFFLISAGVIAQTVLQLHVPSELRGRVMSFFGLVFRGGPAVGALVLGLLAERLGLRATLALGALAFLLFWLWLWGQRRRIAAALRTDRAND